MKNIAICCVTYNRKESLNRLLTSLNDAYYNRAVTLIISIDKSKTDDVERFANEWNWNHGEKRVIKHNVNLGLRNHILSCGDLLNEFDALIVLEDDLSVSPSCFLYAEQCVEKYYDDDRIAGISLYSPAVNINSLMPFVPMQTDSDVYLMQLAQSWGQVWMKKQWKEFVDWYNSPASDFKEERHLPRSILYWSEKSWLKYHIKYCIEKQKYFVYPYVSLSTDHSEAGEHNTKINSIFEVSILRDEKKRYNLNPSVRYDAFFENEGLYNRLGLDSDSVCLDINGNKGNRENKRYWLTMRKLGYKVIRSYGLVYKPIEINVIEGTKGNDIFLYDTSVKVKKNALFGSCRLIPFLYNYNGLFSHIKYTIKYLLGYKQF